jgi:hypothetical protein
VPPKKKKKKRETEIGNYEDLLVIWKFWIGKSWNSQYWNYSGLLVEL